MNRHGRQQPGHPGDVGVPTFAGADIAAYPTMSNQKGLPAPDGFNRPGGPAFQGGYDWGAGPGGGGASTDPLAFFQTGIQSGYDFGGVSTPTPGGVALQRSFPGGYFAGNAWGEEYAKGAGNFYRYARPFGFQGGYNWGGQSQPPRPDLTRLANRYHGFRSGYQERLAESVNKMNAYPRPDFPGGYISNRFGPGSMVRAGGGGYPPGTAQGYLGPGYHEAEPCDFHFQPLESGAMVFQCGSAKAHLRPSSCGYDRTLEIVNFDCGNLADCVEFLRVSLDLFGGLHASPEFDGAGNALQDAMAVFIEGGDMTAAARPVVADVCPQLQAAYGNSPLAYVLMTADVAAGQAYAAQAQVQLAQTAAGYLPGPGVPGSPFRQPAYVVGAAPQGQGLLTTQQLLTSLVEQAGGQGAALEVSRLTETGEQVPHIFRYEPGTQMFSHGPKAGMSTTLTGEAITNLYGGEPMWSVIGVAQTQPQAQAVAGYTVGRSPQRLHTDKDGNPLNVGDAVKFAIEVQGKRKLGAGRLADIQDGLLKIRTTKNYKRPAGKGNKSDLQVTFPVSQAGVAFIPGAGKGDDLFVAIDA